MGRHNWAGWALDRLGCAAFPVVLALMCAVILSLAIGTLLVVDVLLDAGFWRPSPEVVMIGLMVLAAVVAFERVVYRRWLSPRVDVRRRRPPRAGDSTDSDATLEGYAAGTGRAGFRQYCVGCGSWQPAGAFAAPTPADEAVLCHECWAPTSRMQRQRLRAVADEAHWVGLYWQAGYPFGVLLVALAELAAIVAGLGCARAGGCRGGIAGLIVGPIVAINGGRPLPVEWVTTIGLLLTVGWVGWRWSRPLTMAAGRILVGIGGRARRSEHGGPTMLGQGFAHARATAGLVLGIVVSAMVMLAGFAVPWVIALLVLVVVPAMGR